jgi:hypothetical protein
MSVGSVNSPNQCVEPNQSNIPDKSGSDDKVAEQIQDAFNDLAEAACKEIPFVPDSWCNAVGDAVETVLEEGAKVPPELQWNLESS